MDQLLFKKFGNSEMRMKSALDSLRKGKGVLVVDDENRENEGDLIYPAESLTETQMAVLIRECSGIVCLCLTREKANSLGLRMMVEKNQSRHKTAFTISIEAARGVTTGVSAGDRVRTIQAAIHEEAGDQHVVSPGHVFPLVAQQGGVLERRGHTEAAVDLMILAGLKPFGVLCELTNPDGTMARLREIITFAQTHHLPVVTVEDIAAIRKK